MDVYVVSNVWDREGATVIGAAASPAAAEEIADRTPGEPILTVRWDAWEDRSDRPGPSVRERVALLADGTVHPSLSQEIVKVPLAGYISDWPVIKPIDETGPALLRGVPALALRAEIEEIGRSFGAP